MKHQMKEITNKGNLKENYYRQDHVYHTGNEVLLKNDWKTKINQHTCILTENKNN